MLLIRRIWFKLSTIFTLLLGRSEDILTSKWLSRLLNLLSSIERPRTFFNSSSNLLLHRCTVWDGVDGKTKGEECGDGIEEADTVCKPILKSFVHYPLSELGTMMYQYSQQEQAAITMRYGFVAVYMSLLIQVIPSNSTFIFYSHPQQPLWKLPNDLQPLFFSIDLVHRRQLTPYFN